MMGRKTYQNGETINLINHLGQITQFHCIIVIAMLRREKRHDFVIVNDNEFCTAMRSSTKEIYEREKRAGSFTMKRRMKNSCATGHTDLKLWPRGSRV